MTQQVPGYVTISTGGTIQNPGFAGGIAVHSGQTYTLSFYARGSGTATFKADFSGGLGGGSVETKLTSSWTQYNMTIEPTASSGGGNTFYMSLVAGALADVAFLSLIPPLWKGQRLRADIAQAYADLGATHVRIPGGNDVEGHNYASRFQWDQSIGPCPSRPGRKGSWVGWNTEAFGLHEYLDFVESIGAEAVLGVYAGYSLDGSLAPDMSAVTKSTVNELHYITDDASSGSKWAKLRAQNGRSQPWKLNLIEIRNEDNLDTAPKTYQNRFNTITTAINKEFGKGKFDLVST